MNKNYEKWLKYYENATKEQVIEDMTHDMQELQRKDNNWNELKKFVENELNSNVDKEKSFMGHQCKVILDKINELEERK